MDDKNYYKEGSHLIRRVVKLPSSGSTNYLYTIIGEDFKKLYRWLPDKTWEIIELSGEVQSEIFLQEGNNVTITGKGTAEDPYIISSISSGGTDDQVASEVGIDSITGLSATNVQGALEELKALISPTETNLSLANRDIDSLDIVSSSGDDVTLPEATTLLAGLMSGGDKSKLDALPEASELPAIKTKKVTLSALQITNLDSSPVIVIDAPGVGKFIQLIGVSVNLKVGNIPFDDTQALRFRNATVSPKAQFICNTINLQSAVDFFGLAVPIEVGESQIAENQDMVVTTSTTNITQGNGTIDLYLTYQVFNT